MDEIFINFHNCHGIKKFKNTFNFNKDLNSNKNTNVSLIYAPNGTMKTSFAKTLKDLGLDKSPMNVITKKKPKCTVKIKKNGKSNKLTAEDIKNRIFVIDSLNEDFNFLDTAPLISNEEYRNEYTNISNEILNCKKDFLHKIREKSDIKVPKDINSIDYVEKAILNDFNCRSGNILDLFQTLKNNLTNYLGLDSDSMSYRTLFNDKVSKLMDDEEFLEYVKLYCENLDNLLEKSKIFNKNSFTHDNAFDLMKSIKKNNLFDAGHKLKFKSKGTPIDNLEDLNNLISSQIDNIFNDSESTDIFKKINNKFRNNELKEFREIILKNKFLLYFLDDYNNFKKKYWISLFNFEKDLFLELVEKYENKKIKLKEIKLKAEKEHTNWEKIINLFNNRFNVPFNLELGNQEDVILKESIPNIKYFFQEGMDKQEISLDILKSIYSTGQKRALYLLNILYKIEMKKNSDNITLLIFDDIADSFDYQNKYAIIEYLNDLANDERFRCIILTHNYDFYRTVKSRINCKECYFALKTKYEIKLDKDKINNHNNIFLTLSEDLNITSEDYYVKLIALIPFIRNLAELKQDKHTMNLLTNIVHYKEEGKGYTFNDLKDVYFEWNIHVCDDSKIIYDVIFDEAKKIINGDNVGINIKNKILLSIAIRLKAEMFMFSRLNVDELEINSNQTRKLYKYFKKDFPEEYNSLEILEKVNMMTPENIHINSFMYEPILDMDDFYLKDLYKNVLELNNE